MALTRTELDASTCQTPGCNHTHHAGLFLKQLCHVHGGLDVEYREGVLYVTCRVCKARVADVAVAAGAGLTEPGKS